MTTRPPIGIARAVTAVVAFTTVAAGAAAGTLVFDGFDDISLLTLNGACATAATGDGTVLRVTPALGGQSGSAFSSATVDATNFSSAFAFRITKPGGSIFDCNETVGADGIVFVVQSVSSSIGGIGAGIGYAGIGDSVGIEIDTWCNAANNDPSSNHLGIDLEGNVNHGGGAPFTANVEPDFDNGELWYVWVDYDGTTLEVRLSDIDVQPQQPILTRELDLPAILGQDTAFVGFTSGTGADWGHHDIVFWSYDLFSPVCVGDLTGDGAVDGSDLGVLLGNWGSDLEFYDLNGDDEVDGKDIGVLLSAWGPCP